MLELAEYLIKVGQEMQLKNGIVWLLVWIGICHCRIAKIKNEVDNITNSILSLGLAVWPMRRISSVRIN